MAEKVLSITHDGALISFSSFYTLVWVFLMSILQSLGLTLARYLVRPGKNSAVAVASSRPELLETTLRKGDVLLVEGNSRFSVAVKYLTQSTWSHAAIYIGSTDASGIGMFLEADVVEGVRLVPVSHYWHFHTRICRAVGLSEKEIDQVVENAMTKIGYQYDLKNIFDLARYLVRTPPVPSAWRRRMLSLGSGDATRAICSSLIAEAFQALPYPILPEVVVAQACDAESKICYEEMLHIRHHSLYTPRDFDLSPYFQVVKPTIESGFDPHNLFWVQNSLPAEVVKGE